MASASGVETIPILLRQHFYRVRSLQEIAAVNVIGLVCINLELADASCEEVYRILLRLGLPSTMNSLLRQLVWPVSKSVGNWRMCQFPKAGSSTNKMTASQFVAKQGLHWMWCGVVDSEKMATLIVRDENFGVAERFAIACEHSLSGDIHSLWSELPTAIQQCDVEDNELVTYWKALLNGPYKREWSYGMYGALCMGNLSSVKRFWSQMTPSEHSQNILDYASSGFHYCSLSNRFYQPCVVPFFFSHIDFDHWKSILPGHLITFVMLLHCLMTLPWQSLFIPLFDAALSSLENKRSHYDALLAELPSMIVMCLRLAGGKGDFIDPTVEDNVIYIWQKLSVSQRGQFFAKSRLAFKTNMGAIFASESRRCLDIILDGADCKLLKNLAISDSCIAFVSENIERGDCKVAELTVRYLLPRDILELRRYEQKIIRNIVTDENETDIFQNQHQLVYVDYSTFAVRLNKIIRECFKN